MKINPVIEEHQAISHIPSKIGYGLNQIYKDLLCFSAIHLKLEGRLVCWYPLFRYIFDLVHITITVYQSHITEHLYYKLLVVNDINLYFFKCL